MQRPNRDRVKVETYLSRGLCEWLTREAERRGVTRSRLIRELLEAARDRHDRRRA